MTATLPRSSAFMEAVADHDHLVQFYDDEGAFLDTLEGFAVAGLITGESVIVIATPEHREALGQRLKARGLDLVYAEARDQYVVLDADDTLARFMVGGLPDEAYFDAMLADLLARARVNGRRVRAFGEMVVLLWQRGNTAATMRLEHLWAKACLREELALLCAYPQAVLDVDAPYTMQDICSAHTRVVA